MPRRVRPEAGWLAEAARTNLWLVPSCATLGAAALFAVTRSIDSVAYDHRWQLPSWIIAGSADGARQILTTLAAALITVVGVVFSIILVALTLNSTQFGPRMLRNFVRDRGTQWTLGSFVATFVYAMLSLAAIGGGSHGAFVPHISITVVLALTLVDVGVLIYFIHHVAVMIQLPQVIASIARDLAAAVEHETDGSRGHDGRGRIDGGPELDLLHDMMERGGGVVPAPDSGYLQFVRRDRLVELAERFDAVIKLHHRPGHFVVRGHPFLTVWPADAAPAVERWVRTSHITGPYRTLTQDVAFAVDQLVEIAIRALSAAVNDTFTALTCIDWLGESLCRIARDWDPDPIRRDERGVVRLISAPISYERLIQRAFEKIRQASAGMPAVLIRQLDAITLISRSTHRPERLPVLLAQAEMIHRLAVESVAEPADLADINTVYRELLELHR
ncbi:DUF2254 domain-containing protein [Actinospica durhamensis]|uniref:DUF2254 domain-containing protein n=1 Tax=Actinospica durhamensis TaxID=1508375 RepID=A0A941EV05_9ACTN|nr:DUF2254 domain-containing protein [Actinospica durhamensis]MBR7837486.1 DUF2254 domain-containing protein [Actinospica durhamensis]